MITYTVRTTRSTSSDALRPAPLAVAAPGAASASSLALPIGYLAVRFPWLYQPIVNTGGVLYSIPSLALFVVLPAGPRHRDPLAAQHRWSALTIYTLALLARTVADALTSVQGQTTQAAHAMGYRPLRQLFERRAADGAAGDVRRPAGGDGGQHQPGQRRRADRRRRARAACSPRGFQLGFIEPIMIGIVLSMLLAAICRPGAGAAAAAAHPVDPDGG